jgi:two-component system, NtrC family, sensor kinase
MSLTRKAPTAAKRDGRPKRQDLVQALAEREAELLEARRQNTRLFDELQTRSQDLTEALEHQTAASEVLSAISRSPTEVQPVFDAIARSATELCGATSGGVDLLDRGLIRLVSHYNWSPEALEAMRRIYPAAPSRGFASARAILTRSVVHIPDISKDPEYTATPVVEIGFRSVLAVPMVRDGQPIGSIALVRLEPRPFTDRQITLLQTFAEQAVIAINNVRLFEEVEAREREVEEALKQQTATADVFKVISRSTFDLQTVLHTLVVSAAKLCDADKATITRELGGLYYRAESYGFSEEFMSRLRDVPVTAERGTVSGRALLEGVAIQVADVQSDPEYTSKEYATVGEFRTCLAIPMLRNGAPIGVLVMFRAEVRPFNNKQIELVQTFADQAVIAIENVRLFDEVQAKTRDLEESLQQQTATANVLKVISRSAFHLDAVLKTLTDSARSLSGAATAAVFLRDGETLVVRAESGCNSQFLEYLAAHPPSSGRGTFTGRVLMTAAAAHIPDVLADPDYAYGAGPRLGNYRSGVGVPLLRDGRVDGVFGLMHPEPGAFTPRVIELLKTFADQAVIAIENARLFSEVQAKTRDLEESLQQQTATADVLKVISRSAFDLQAVLHTLVESAAKLCDADKATITRQIDGVFYRAESYGFSEEFMTQIRDVPVAPERGSISGRVMLEGKAVHVEDVEVDPDYWPKSFAKQGELRTGLGIPMMRNGAPIGVLALMRTEVRPFNAKQIELVQTFADQAVIAIENARLFDEVQAKTRDLQESLEQQTASAEILRVISSSPTDVQPVFDAIAHSAAVLCEATNGTVFRLRDGLIHLVGYYSLSQAQLTSVQHSFPAPLDRGTASGRAILECGVVHIRDIAADREYSAHSLLKTGLRSVLSVPMLRNGEPIGSINVSRDVVRPFSKRQIELLKTFADQAVIAINNVGLFNETREALEQQKASADILGVISKSVADAQPVFEKILESCKRLFDGDELDVLLIDDEGLLQVVAYLGKARDTIMATFPAPWEVTPAGRAIRERRVANYSDVLNNPDTPPVLRRVGKIVGYHSVAFAPMVWEDRGIGAVGVARSRGAFTEKEIALLQTFADQAVIAIQNARMFEEVQAKTRDLTEALQQQTATANVLKVISRSAFDLQAVLTTLAESARDLCGASFVTLSLREGDAMRLRAESGCTPEIVQFMVAHPIRAGRETFTGRVMLSGEAVHLPDVFADPEYDFGEGPRIGNYRALLAVPLLREGGGEDLRGPFGVRQVLGVFALARPDPAPFTERQIEMVRAFADQAVIAIENARLFNEVQFRTKELAASLDDLRKAQDRLIQSEKLASLGQLTAGIAHEIKNPLNFINNYSALSRELIDELADAIKGGADDEAAHGEADELIGAIGGNLDKIVQHGKRADSIVKNMLLHSREGSGERATTNVNTMVEEALNLAYHGARAEKPGFNVTIAKSLDPNAGAAEVFAQEMTRVLLNLISNGFYATTKRKQNVGDGAYEPTIAASTRDLGPKVEIVIRDNGVGISDEVKAKMFNPFFTTKPAGEGTGLGLSLSHDIVVKQHGGTIEVLTEPDAFTQFTIVLPRGATGA